MPGTTCCRFGCNLTRRPRLAARRRQHVRLGASRSASAWFPAPQHLHLPGHVPRHHQRREFQEVNVAGRVPQHHART
eukprot:9196085-Pyramimonas_sp.AAC.1